MKKTIYSIINKLGFRIENRKKQIQKDVNYLSKFQVKNNKELLYKSRFYIKKINDFYPDLNIIDNNSGLLVTFLNIKLYVETVEEFFILGEVFVDQEYHFVSNSNYTIFDIGANIGVATLFFSTLENVEKIYAFEPVLETFNQAKLNLSLNDRASKITELNNFGLGSSTREEEFMFDRTIKGNTGLRGDLSPSYAANQTNSVAVKVEIKDASVILSDYISKTSNSKIVVKIDCEGAEYEIFDTIVNSNCIKKVDIFMIEWHDKGATSIEEKLTNSGFDYFSKKYDKNSGMIYAFKRN